MISAGATASPRITKPHDEAAAAGERVTVGDFDMGLPSSFSAPAVVEATSVALDATLVAVDEQGNVVSALPVQFRRRVHASGTVTLFGTDDSGAISVVATVTTDPPHVKVNLRHVGGGAALPRQLLASFRFLRALRRPNRLALNVGERRMGEFGDLPADAEFPGEQVELVRSLAFVQAMTRTEFAVPAELEHDEVRALKDAESLLRGETISSRWTDATLSLSRIDEFLRAVQGSNGFQVEMVAPMFVCVAENEMPLGDARYVFRAAILDNYDELVALAERGEITEVDARLRPHPDDDTYEVALVAPPEIGLDLNDVRSPVVIPGAELAEARQRPLRPDAFRSAAS